MYSKFVYLDLQEQFMKWLYNRDPECWLMIESANIAWEIERYNILRRLGYFE